MMTQKSASERRELITIDRYSYIISVQGLANDGSIGSYYLATTHCH